MAKWLEKCYKAHFTCGDWGHLLIYDGTRFNLVLAFFIGINYYLYLKGQIMDDVLSHIPYDIVVDSHIVVNQTVTHACHLAGHDMLCHAYFTSAGIFFVASPIMERLRVTARFRVSSR